MPLPSSCRPIRCFSRSSPHGQCSPDGQQVVQQYLPPYTAAEKREEPQPDKTAEESQRAETGSDTSPPWRPPNSPIRRRGARQKAGQGQPRKRRPYALLTVTKCIKVSFPRRNTEPSPSCRARPITSHGSTARCGCGSPDSSVPRYHSRRNWLIISGLSSTSSVIILSP